MYEIPGRKKSIIDLAMASSLKLVSDFTVIPNVIGLSLQTCHKVILLSLNLSSSNFAEELITQDKPYERKMFKQCTYEQLLDVRERVYTKLREIEYISSKIDK